MHKAIAGKSAFTLVETIVTVAIVGIGLSVAMTGYVFLVKSHHQAEIQDELDIEVQWAIERLKKDIRLSSLDEIFFYPSDQVDHTAVSFPLASDTDGDGVVDVNTDGEIDWDRTVIYHVWLTTPNELRITVFDPRDDSLSDVERQAQLESVIQHGDGRNAQNGENSTTHTVFRNLFTWNIRPRGAVFDGYALTAQREQNVNLGSCLLSPGNHDFRFTLIGKCPEAAGLRVGIDQLFVSPCALPREGEAQLPETSRSGAIPTVLYRPDGSWHGNYELHFPADDIGDTFTLTMANDRWEETNFTDVEQQLGATIVRFDESQAFKDFVVELAGNQIAWEAGQQSGDPSGGSSPIDTFRGTAVRVILKGEEMINGNWVTDDGAACKVSFRAGNGAGNALAIRSASIAECVSRSYPHPDVVPGTQCALTFGGSTECLVTHLDEVWSDLTDFPIDSAKSYAVSFVMDTGAASGTPWVWEGLRFPSETNSYVLPQTNAFSETMAANAVWSTNATLLAFPHVIGIAAMHVTYTTNGHYTSRILDTQVEQPAWGDMAWHADKPAGTALSVKVRTGTQPDLADAPDWSNVVTRTVSGPLMGLPQERYLQLQFILEASPHGQNTPVLRDVAINW